LDGIDERDVFHGQPSGLPVKCLVGFAPSPVGLENRPDDLLLSPCGLFLVEGGSRNGEVGFLPSPWLEPNVEGGFGPSTGGKPPRRFENKTVRV
jgi:hypothetical protein